MMIIEISTSRNSLRGQTNQTPIRCRQPEAAHRTSTKPEETDGRGGTELGLVAFCLAWMESQADVTAEIHWSRMVKILTCINYNYTRHYKTLKPRSPCSERKPNLAETRLANEVEGHCQMWGLNSGK